MYEINWWIIGKYLRCSSGICSPDQPSEIGKKAKGKMSLCIQILEKKKQNEKQQAIEI